MPFPSADTPLYNHPLPEIEQWLRSKGCRQDLENLHCWHLETSNWQADIWMEVDALSVRYINAGEEGRDLLRSFKYSLSRQDLEEVIFSGP